METGNGMEHQHRVRKLEITDKSKGFIELLQQLTTCDSVSDKEFEDRFQELCSYGDDHLICVIEDEESGKIIATGCLFIEKKFIRNCGKVGHIEDVVVDSNSRGLQLGKKVIDFLTDHAKSKGCYKVILDCNNENVGFYEKCGFKQKEIQMVRLISYCQLLMNGKHLILIRGENYSSIRRCSPDVRAFSGRKVDELDKAVSVAARDPAFYGINEAELERRRKWTKNARDKVGTIRMAVGKGLGYQDASNTNGTHRELMRYTVGDSHQKAASSQYTQDNDDFVSSESDRQMLLMKQQDQELDELSASVQRIGHVGLTIHDELIEQERIMDDLGAEIDSTSNRLDFLQKKVAFVMKKAGAKGQLMII